MVAKKTKTAFSLIEISVVLLIIGILIAGISQGMDLYYDTKLNLARQLTSSSRVPRIIGLVSWYESTSSKSFNDYEVKDGEMIYKWNDANPSSTNKINLIQTNSIFQPIFASNGINDLPSLKFNGSKSFLQTNGYVPEHNSPTFTFFAVTQTSINSSSFYKSIFCNREDINSLNSLVKGWVAYSYNNQYAIYVGNGTSRWTEIFALSTIKNLSDILSVVYNGTDFDIYKNSTNKFSRSSAYSLNTTKPSSVGSNGGCDQNLSTNNNYPFDGFIGEIILYDRNISNSERLDVEKYLAKKWGIGI